MFSGAQYHEAPNDMLRVLVQVFKVPVSEQVMFCMRQSNALDFGMFSL